MIDEFFIFFTLFLIVYAITLSLILLERELFKKWWFLLLFPYFEKKPKNKISKPAAKRR